jgi:outer membrane protein assembly factor BamE
MRTRKSLTLSLVLTALLLGASGCVYRMAIQQGNFLDTSQVEQLQNGMTRSQVMFLLGTPMVPAGFDANRWDYFYYLKARQLKKPITRRLTVYFEEDKVSRIVNGDAPTPTPTPTPPST